MRVAILWDWHLPLEELIGNDDGVIATFRELAGRDSAVVFTGTTDENCNFWHRGLEYQLCRNQETMLSEVEKYKPDAIFCWGSLDRPWFKIITDAFPSLPKGLRFAGGPHDNPIGRRFTTVFCESDSDADSLSQRGVQVVRGATAVNVDLFKPIPSKKIFKAVYPTSFCGHKFIEIFADAFSGQGLVCGTQNDPKLAEYCRQRGVLAWPRLPASAMPHIYASAHSAAATGGVWGGSQRMVLEAMACNVPPLVLDSNVRCHDYIKESGYGVIAEGDAQRIAATVNEWVEHPPEPIGRDYVLSKFTPAHYADRILSGLQEPAYAS